MSTFPFSNHNYQNGSYYQKSNLGFNSLSPNNSYTNASSINSSHYYTYYQPIKSYKKDGNDNRPLDFLMNKEKKIQIDSYDLSKRSNSVYTYPYNYSNDYLSYLQNEKKKKQEYNTYLKKQIEEKQELKALEYKKQQEEKAREEERYRSTNQILFNSNNQSIPNYHNYAGNANGNANINDNGISKISLNGMSIIDALSNNTIRNGGGNGFDNNFRSVQGYSCGINTDQLLVGSLVSQRIGGNTIYMSDRTSRLPPPYQGDNFSNELIFSNCDKHSLNLPTSLANIDLSALKYHSKYENYDNGDGNSNSVTHINNNLIGREKDKEYYTNNLNSNTKENLKASLKGRSTFVQADDSKGIQIENGFLKAWNTEEKNNKETLIGNENINVPNKHLDNNTDIKQLLNEKSQPKIYDEIHSKSRQKKFKPSLNQNGSLFKDSKFFYNTKDVASRFIAKPNNPIMRNDIKANVGVGFGGGVDAIGGVENKEYNKAIGFQDNIPLPVIDQKRADNSNINDNTAEKIDKYMSDLINGINSPLYPEKKTSYTDDYTYKPFIANKDSNYAINSKKESREFNYNKRDNNNKAATNCDYNTKIDNDIYLYKNLVSKENEIDTKSQSIDTASKKLKMSFEEQELYSKQSRQTKDTKNDDELCNVRYDSDSDNDHFISKQEDNEEEGEKKDQEKEEITCNFIDDDDDDNIHDIDSKNQTNSNKQPIITSKDKEEINQGRDSKNDTGRFQSQANFFDQSVNESFAIKKSQNHKVKPEILSFGLPNQSNQITNSNDKCFITTIKDVQSKMVTEQQSSSSVSSHANMNNNKKNTEESIDIRDSFAEKIIKDIGNYQLKDISNSSLSKKSNNK